MQIYEWTIGVDLSLGAPTVSLFIRNCEFECWATALNIQLPGNAASAITSGVKVTSCTLAKASDSTDGSAIIVIDAQLPLEHNTNAQLHDITLTDCTVINLAAEPPSGQYGLNIRSGTDIKVIGGTYSNNGSAGGAGIAITGSCGDVQIIGANLQPTYPDAPNLNAQQFGLLVSAIPAGSILVSGCDINGYTPSGTAAVEVTAPMPNNGLFITNCPGYNDKNTACIPLPSQLTSLASGAACPNP